MNEDKKEIGPEQFFNIEHPGDPYVEIQFKTSQAPNGNINDATWESVTLENNFFDSLTITDESGFQELEITLRDRDFVNIEDIILRTVLCSRVSSWAGFYTAQDSSGVSNRQKYEAATTSLKTQTPESSDTIMKNTFQVYIDNTEASAIRVRFGWGSNQKGYYETLDYDKYKERTEQTRPIIRSPWLYFMILGANYNIDSGGHMSFQIKGISTVKAYLERSKFLMNGTVLEGLPEEIWKVMSDRIYEGSGEKVLLVNKTGETRVKEVADITDVPKGIEASKEPDEDFFKYQAKPIKLSSLYENPMIFFDSSGNEKRSLHFKSLRQLITDFINLLNSKYIDYDGAVIIDKEGQDIDMSQIHHVEKPDFYVTSFLNQGKVGGTDAIHLYYRKPSIKNQKYIRVYSWKDSKNSIIKNFSLSTENDFAQMNAPITIKTKEWDNKEGKEVEKLRQINFGSITADLDGIDYNIDTVKEVSQAMNNIKGKLGFITADVYKPSNYNDSNGFVSSFIQNLNDNVFKGTIDLFLDPFYLFDSNLKPYDYLIKIDVNTPSRYLTNGVYVPGSKSYLTGYYMIGKITHKISASEATTTLEVIKYPDEREGFGTNKEKINKVDIANQLDALLIKEKQNHSKILAKIRQRNDLEEYIKSLETIYPNKDYPSEIQKQVDIDTQTIKEINQDLEELGKLENDLQNTINSQRRR